MDLCERVAYSDDALIQNSQRLTRVCGYDLVDMRLKPGIIAVR